MGQWGENSKDMTARAGQLGQASKTRTARTGKPEEYTSLCPSILLLTWLCIPLSHPPFIPPSPHPSTVPQLIPLPILIFLPLFSPLSLFPLLPLFLFIFLPLHRSLPLSSNIRWLDQIRADLCVKHTDPTQIFQLQMSLEQGNVEISIFSCCAECNVY